jgi:hypothetical protein
VVECAEGDMAIDAGGCYGDTALYFAHKTGPRGPLSFCRSMSRCSAGICS